MQNLQNFVAAQEKVNAKLMSNYPNDLVLSVVATNDIHYIEQSDWRAHEILLNIQSGESCQIWERDSRGNPKNKVPKSQNEIRIHLTSSILNPLSRCRR